MFSGNNVSHGSDIYGSLTLSMCPWSPYYPWPVSYYQLSQLFPTVFDFEELPQGTENIEGLPSTMVIAGKQPVYPLSPGQSVLLNMTTYDSHNQTRSNVILSFVDFKENNANYTFLLNGAIPIYQLPFLHPMTPQGALYCKYIPPYVLSAKLSLLKCSNVLMGLNSTKIHRYASV